MPTLVRESTRSAPMPAAPSEPATPANEVVVRVVGDRPAQAGGGRQRTGLTLRGVLIALVVGAVGLALFLVAGALTGLFHLENPFGTSRVDRTPPALLKQLSNLSDYHAAQATFLVRVDVEDDVAVVPSFLAGERTLFNATGTVDATVDFSKLSTDAVQVSGDTVTITLPEPAYAKPVVDPTRSEVVDRDRGLVNRIGDVFGDDTNNERDLYVLAGKKLAAAARESNLRARAEKNTRLMLEGLVGRLGFTHVDVTFTPAVPSPRPAPTK
ncbi:MAG TPA: DUF4230 domain-containing protein [Acidimicrobiia bacterium]|jgi:hypothetical protein